jgi:predicted DNA-binding transcriptional regulator AlpA
MQGRRLVDSRGRRQKVPLSDTQVWRLEKVGRFPQRVQLSTHKVAWYEDELDKWIAERIRGGGRRPGAAA